MFSLRFLASPHVDTGVTPWEWEPSTPFPDNIRRDKKARDAWANNPQTVSNFYTGFEGLNASLRVSQKKEDSENPPVKEHFLVADYDCPTADALVEDAAKNFNPPPNRLEKTLSGNWRAIWFLERPIIIPSYAWAKHFKKVFPSIAFDPGKMLPGFDRGAWEAPERFWTNSGEWFVCHDEKIPGSQIEGWQFLASQKFNFKGNFKSAEIPAEVAAEELVKKYPKFSQWPGEFILGSQGPTFWVDGSTSPKSAIVRETGMQTFSDHAGKGFFTWAELLGADFTRTYQADATGRQAEGIYYDGKDYWVQEARGWKPYDVTNLARILRTDRGVNPAPDKQGVSDIDRLVRYIQSNQDIDGAVPLICRRPGLVNVNGNRFLNTHTKPFLAPVPGVQVWGPTGNFPNISRFLDHFFDRGDARQLQFFLSWLAHFYRSGINLTPTSGLIVVIAGDAGRGKSFLVHGLVGKLAGGVGEAADFLGGSDSFGSENFSKAVWAIDDGKSAADYKDHKRFSEGLKRAAANDTVRYHAKYRIPVVITWQGRVMISLNKDADSLRVVPELDISILDKLSIFHISDKQFPFPERDEWEAIIEREIGFFAAYLRDYQMPDYCKPDSTRFGVKPWQDREITARVRTTSNASAFYEILEDWMKDFFIRENPGAEYWEGVSFDLHKQLCIDIGRQNAMRDYNVIVVGRRMQNLVSTKTPGFTMLDVKRHNKCVFRIDRPAHFPPADKSQKPKK